MTDIRQGLGPAEHAVLDMLSEIRAADDAGGLGRRPVGHLQIAQDRARIATATTADRRSPIDGDLRRRARAARRRTARLRRGTMKHQPIGPARIHALGCGCGDCNPHRVICVTRLLKVWATVFLPAIGLLWAAWTMLPR